MRYTLLTILLLVGFLGKAQVSNAEFDNIAKKFEKGKFEAALETAESTIDKGQHRKKPEPYLWASMCFYELSNSEDERIQERFKYALRNALKYAGRAYDKDKNGNLVDNNRAYFDELKAAGIERAKEYEAEDNERKANYTYKQLQRMEPSDVNIQFAKGVSDIKMSNTYDADRELREALPKLTESYKDMGYKPDPVSESLLKDAVVYYIDHLVQNSLADSARNVTMVARLFFPLDEEINKRYEQLK